MRFSNLKKKFPSLRVGVLVIAAFALLGSMMIPSISEKMGLNESRCLAGYGGYEYVDECDTEYRNCLHDCITEYERKVSINKEYCKDLYGEGTEAYRKMLAVFNAADYDGFKKCENNCRQKYLK